MKINDSLNLTNSIKTVKSTVNDNVNYAYNTPKEYVENLISKVIDKLHEKVVDVKDYTESKYTSAKKYT